MNTPGELTEAAPLAHEQLLTLARKVQAAAHDEDTERLGSSLRRLVDTLNVHLAAEEAAMSRIPDDRRESLTRGQGRLIELLARLTRRTEHSPRTSGRVADELVDFLSLQAEDEHRHLRPEIVAPADPRARLPGNRNGDQHRVNAWTSKGEPGSDSSRMP